MKQIAVINGSNINILGLREPEIYGETSWEEIQIELENYAVDLGCSLIFYQSNHEGNIVDFIQRNMDNVDAIIINPASFSKMGYSILDALNARRLPYVEVHLSNIVNRGSWHAESIFTEDSIGCIFGFKSYVYILGLYALNNYLEEQKNENISN